MATRDRVAAVKPGVLVHLCCEHTEPIAFRGSVGLEINPSGKTSYRLRAAIESHFDDTFLARKDRLFRKSDRNAGAIWAGTEHVQFSIASVGESEFLRNNATVRRIASHVKGIRVELDGCYVLSG